jgi:hypothetical protein
MMEKKNIVKVIRYVRPLVVDNGKLIESNMGGIALRIEINQSAGQLLYSYALCGDADNFNFKIATDIVNGRFVSGAFQICDYIREISLVENVIVHLDSFKPMWNDLSTLKRKLNEITHNNAFLKKEFARIQTEYDEAVSNPSVIMSIMDEMGKIMPTFFQRKR